MILFVLSQIFAGLSIYVDLKQRDVKSKARLLILLSISSAFYGLHFLLLGQHFACLLTVVAIIRFYLAGKYQSKLLPALFVTLNIGIGTIFFLSGEWSSAESMILVASTINILSVFATKLSTSQIGLMTGTLIWIFYNVSQFSVFGVISELIFFTALLKSFVTNSMRS